MLPVYEADRKQTDKPVGDVARDAASFAAQRGQCLLAQAVLRTDSMSADGRSQPQTRCLTISVIYSMQHREPTDGQTDRQIVAHLVLRNTTL